MVTFEQFIFQVILQARSLGVDPTVAVTEAMAAYNKAMNNPPKEQ